MVFWWGLFCFAFFLLEQCFLQRNSSFVQILSCESIFSPIESVFQLSGKMITTLTVGGVKFSINIISSLNLMIGPQTVQK